MYNVIDQNPDLSYFPTEEGKKLFGLISYEQKLEASAFYNLRAKPASVLLFHGKDDYLCHYSQSEKYAAKNREAGAKAKVVLYENINHTCLNPAYPEVFRNSLMEMARFYTEEFQLENSDFTAIETDLENRLGGMYPSSEIKAEQLVGTWVNKKEKLVFNQNGKGQLLNNKSKKTKSITYINNGSSIYIIVNGTENRRTFYLRKNNKSIYESIEDNSRLKSRRIDYKKQKLI